MDEWRDGFLCLARAKENLRGQRPGAAIRGKGYFELRQETSAAARAPRLCRRGRADPRPTLAKIASPQVITCGEAEPTRVNSGFSVAISRVRSGPNISSNGGCEARLRRLMLGDTGLRGISQAGGARCQSKERSRATRDVAPPRRVRAQRSRAPVDRRNIGRRA